MTEEQKWEMIFRLMVALAKRNLKDAQNEDGNWPMMMDWDELVGSSKSVFMRKAREEAGVNHETYLNAWRTNDFSVTDWAKKVWGK